jgi:hypothetical protein
MFKLIFASLTLAFAFALFSAGEGEATYLLNRLIPAASLAR